MTNDSENTAPRTTSWTRRGFLCAAGAATLTRVVPGVDRSPDPGDPTCLVIVNLRGGNDGLNTVPPTQLSSYFDRRPTLAIDPADGVGLARGPMATSDYVLHPAMGPLGDLYELGELAVVHRVGYPDPNLSHFASMDIWARGYRDEDLLPGGGSGWIARYKDIYARDPLGVVGIKTSRLPDFKGGETDSLVVDSVRNFGFALDSKYEDNSRYRNQIARRVLLVNPLPGQGAQVRDAQLLAYDMVSRMQGAADRYDGTTPYPGSTLGRSLQEAAILLTAGFPTRVIYTQTGGYDTHSGQAGHHAGLLGNLAGSLGAFATDLRALGEWGRVIVVVISEFGRRNDENGSNGTDHGSGNVALILGGAVRGGVYGPGLSDPDLAGDHVPFAVDFRDIYREVIERHLGADPNPVFPEARDPATPLGFVL
jgi:uncharacterized protein (DUF1501 family)